MAEAGFSQVREQALFCSLPGVNALQQNPQNKEIIKTQMLLLLRRNHEAKSRYGRPRDPQPDVAALTCVRLRSQLTGCQRFRGDCGDRVSLLCSYVTALP